MRFSEELAAEPERVDGTFPLPPPSHSTLPPVATTSPERLQHARSEPLGSLRDAREQETEARRRLYRLKRELTLAKSESALRAVHERKRASTPSPEADRLKPPVLVDVPRASAEAVREVAALLTVRMRQMGSESAGGERRHDSWFKLFKHMDDDGSGKVAYVEFEGLVRHELQLTPKELPEAALKAVWVALDSDGSGHISVGEFGAFMRKGEPVQDKARRTLPLLCAHYPHALPRFLAFASPLPLSALPFPLSPLPSPLCPYPSPLCPYLSPLSALPCPSSLSPPSLLSLS